MKIPEITRMLVLTGIVTLATDHGSIQAAENEVNVAKANEAPEKITVQANSKLATKLYAQLAKENPDQNIFFSPYSVSTALTMTMEGARSQTAKEMGNVLGFSDSLIRTGDDAQNRPWQMTQINTGSSALHKLLNKENKKSTQKAPIQLKVANAIWAEQSYNFLDSYKQTISTNYATEAFKTADFKNNTETERNRINSWVEDQTNNRIKDLFPANSLDNMTKMVLVNAIYFKGDWKTKFETSSTKERDYTLASGEKTKVQLMQAYGLNTARYAAFNPDGSFFKTPKMNNYKGNYPAKDGFAMVELPYHGNEVSMVVIAPNSADGIGAIESKLNSENLSTWIKQMKSRKIHLAIPKFKSETTYEMKSTLSTMGMPTAFSLGADFSGIDNSTNLYIDTVVHKAFIEVNEAGTQAAAATGVAEAAKGGHQKPKPFTPEFRADRPFIYLIRDTKTGTILFLGRMMNPKG